MLADPRVKGKVATYNVNTSQLSFAQLTAILNVHNFSVYRSDGLLIVVPRNVIKYAQIPIEQEGRTYADNEEIVSTMTLEKLCPQELIPVLRPLLSPISHFAALNEARTIVIGDTYAKVRSVRALTKRIEASAERQKSCS